MFCQKCGNSLVENAAFCEKCGQPAGVAPAPVNTKMPASTGKRFLNYFIDTIIYYILLVIVYVIIGTESGGAWNLFLTYLIMFLYYFICEGFWGRTVAKFITGTKVVNKDGTKPSMEVIAGRSLVRFIPFEGLTFLIGGHPIGWHDRFSKTLVVPVSYKAEDVQKINFEDAKKTGGSYIVIIAVAILVIIAVIGILASIVLTSLSSAKNKAQRAAAMADLRGVIPELIICADDGGYASSGIPNYPLSSGGVPVAGQIICVNSTNSAPIAKHTTVWPTLPSGWVYGPVYLGDKKLSSSPYSNESFIYEAHTIGSTTKSDSVSCELRTGICK